MLSANEANRVFLSGCHFFALHTFILIIPILSDLMAHYFFSILIPFARIGKLIDCHQLISILIWRLFLLRISLVPSSYFFFDVPITDENTTNVLLPRCGNPVLKFHPHIQSTTVIAGIANRKRLIDGLSNVFFFSQKYITFSNTRDFAHHHYSTKNKFDGTMKFHDVEEGLWRNYSNF